MKSFFTHHSLNFFLVLVIGTLFTTTVYGQTRFVSTTGTQPASAAISWASSTTDLQGAINSLSATGGQVWVAAGVYKPTSTTARTISFSMRNNVAIYGGFVGNETDLDLRPSVNPISGQPSSSTLSGEIGDPGSTTDNSYHVISNPQGLTTTAILNGFLITGGNANASGVNLAGGGVYNEGSEGFCHPTFINCVFQGNSATQGGGMRNNTAGSPAGKCSPVLTDCVFQNNSATTGAGLYNWAQGTGNVASPILTNCLFQNNTASKGAGVANAGTTSATARPQFTNCQFLNNRATSQGGGIYNDGQNNGNANGSFVSCLFDGNQAPSGGAVNCFTDAPTGTSSPTFTNCAFQNNSASDKGGVFYNLAGTTNSQASLTLINCSLQNNSASNSGSAFYNWGFSGGLSNPVLINTVLYNNGGNQTFSNNGTASVTATYSLFEPESVTVTGVTISGPGNLTTSVSPFASSASTQLATGSLAIDAGDPTTTTATVGATDLGGNPRIVNSQVDIGAYESQSSMPPVTITGFAPTAATICSGNIVTFTATVGNVTDSYDFTLTNGSSPVSGTTSSTAFSQTLTTSGTGTQTYTLIVSDNGPSQTATTIIVNDAPSLTVTINPSLTITSGNTVTLTASGGSSYTWTGGSIGATFTASPTSTNTYSLTGLNALGCASVTSVAVIVNTPVCYSVVYVTQNGAGLQDGSSWANAYPGTMLQTAINSATMCSGQVWVAAGLYRPTTYTGIGSRSVSFQMRNNVTIYGGFVGNETSVASRTVASPLTGQPSSSTLSGDIGTVGNPNDNSFHVISNTNLTASAVLDGFVITRGYGDFFSANNGLGGGIYNTGSSPTLTNCVFQNNTANAGGALYNEASSNPTLTNCVFLNNLCRSNSGGGAIHNTASSPSLTNCRLQGNTSDTYGGAMYNISSSPALSNCTLVNNSTTYGGAIYNTGGSFTLTNCVLQSNTSTSSGGAIYNLNSSPVLVGCQLLNNLVTGSLGGAIYNDGGSPTLTTCTLQGNSSSSGGGVYNNSGNPILTSCTLVSNTATSQGGGFYLANGSATLTNCSLQNNLGQLGGGIYNGGSLLLTNSLLQGNRASQEGGAIRNSGSDSFTMTGGAVLSNSATQNGGGLWASNTPRITNVLLQGNTANTYGGGIYVSSGSPTLTNCSLQSNSASQGGALFNSGSPTLTNCSFQSNSASQGGAVFNSTTRTTLTNCVVWNSGGANTFSYIFSGTVTASYSLFEPSAVAVAGVNVSGPGNLTTNISPFASTTSTELAPCSPAIDRGNNAATGLTGVTTDLAGNPRFFNNGTVDMGAYEFQGDGAPPTNFSLLGSGTASCASSPTITLSDSETGVSYQLQLNGVNSGTGVTGTGSAISFGTQPQSGTYTVVATRASNSCSLVLATSATVVSSTAAPTVSISASSGTLTCASPTATLTATSGLTNYSFSTGQSGASNLLTVSTAGTYSVVATGANGCTALASTTVVSSSAVISASLVASGAISCSSTSVTLTASPSNLTYVFGGAASQIGSTNQATVSSAGTYSVTVSDAGGCSAVAQVTVTGSTTAPTGATLTASHSGTLTCTNPALTLTASATGSGLSYAVSGMGVVAQSGSSATVNQAGTFTVIITGSNGCTTSASTTVYSNTTAPSLLISPLNATLTCASPSVVLLAIGSGTALWSTSVTASSITVSTGGTYSVTLIGTNGCSQVASTTVTDNNVASSISSLTATGVLSCSTTVVGLQAVASGLNYHFSGPTGYAYSEVFGSVASRTVSATGITQAGVYTLVVSQGSSCSTSQSVTVVQGNQPVSVSLSSIGSIGCGQSSAVIVVQASGASSYTVLGPGSYSQVSASTQFTVSQGGTYTVIAGSGACRAVGVITIQAGGVQPVASSFRSGGVLGAGNCSVPLLATATGDRYMVTGPNGYVYSNVYRVVGTRELVGFIVTKPGTYTLMVYSGNCSATYTTVVTGTACP